MSELIEIPANKSSLARRKLVYGAGINDSKYMTNLKVDGRRLICPYYSKWASMLERCYSKKWKEKYPTYADCIAAKEWLLFSNFRAWMKTKDWEGKHLDKDILIPGNKIYCPEYCIFIPQDLNKLLIDHGAKRGKYPIGVFFHKKNKMFVSKCNVNGKNKYLGQFSTHEAASLAYRKFKSALIVETSEQHPELKEALLVHADLYLRGEIQ